MDAIAYISSASEMGALIRRRRKELGLDQETLARKAGVSRLWISEMERGKETAAIGLVFKTLKALGLTLTHEVRPASVRRPMQKMPLNAAGGVDLDAVLARARRVEGAS